jgi:hypothetical protein
MAKGRPVWGKEEGDDGKEKVGDLPHALGDCGHPDALQLLDADTQGEDVLQKVIAVTNNRMGTKQSRA